MSTVDYQALSVAAAITSTLDFAREAALVASDAVDVKPGKQVLVVGASSGAGSYAGQLLAALGASVIAT